MASRSSSVDFYNPVSRQKFITLANKDSSFRRYLVNYLEYHTQDHSLSSQTGEDLYAQYAQGAWMTQGQQGLAQALKQQQMQVQEQRDPFAPYRFPKPVVSPTGPSVNQAAANPTAAKQTAAQQAAAKKAAARPATTKNAPTNQATKPVTARQTTMPPIVTNQPNPLAQSAPPYQSKIPRHFVAPLPQVSPGLRTSMDRSRYFLDGLQPQPSLWPNWNA